MPATSLPTALPTSSLDKTHGVAGLAGAADQSNFCSEDGASHETVCYVKLVPVWLAFH